MYTPQYDRVHQFIFFVADEKERNCFRGDRNVFVCGGFQNPEKMSKLLGRAAPFAPAVVLGYRRGVLRIGGKAAAFMIPSDDSKCVLQGVVWLGLSGKEVAEIERLELKGGLRKRIRIEARLGERGLSAFTYVRK